MRNNDLGRDRASELSFHLHAPLDTRIHLQFEEANGRSAGRLGAIQRAIGTPDQFLRVGAVVRSYRDANPNTELCRQTLDDKRLRDGSRDAPRQICSVIGGVESSV